MPEPDRLQVRQRPLAKQERADLERQARESERFMLGHWARSLRYWTLIAVAVLLIVGALWWATFEWDLDRRKATLATIGGGLAFLAISGWELHEARTRVRAVRDSWARRLQDASTNHVVEIEVHPARAWGSTDSGWIFEVGGGRALFADWDLPAGSATETIVAAVSTAGGVWFDQDGAELDAEPFPYSWEDVRDDHPLLEMTGPVTFRLDHDAGASFRDFFDPDWLVPPEPRNSD